MRGGLTGADVEVIADHVQEGVATHEGAGAMDGVTVSERAGLGHETDRAGVAAGGLRVSGFIARPDHHADLLDARGEGLFDEDAEDGLLAAVAVDQGLEGQSALVGAGGGDDRFMKSQVGAPGKPV